MKSSRGFNVREGQCLHTGPLLAGLFRAIALGDTIPLASGLAAPNSFYCTIGRSDLVADDSLNITFIYSKVGASSTP